MPSHDDTTHLRLRKTGQYWKFNAEDSFLRIAPLYIFVSLCLLAANDHHGWINHYLLVVSLAALFLVGLSISKHLRYQAIHCPRCGLNPTRKEANQDARLTERYMRRKLERMKVCPRCKDGRRRYRPPAASVAPAPGSGLSTPST